MIALVALLVAAEPPVNSAMLMTRAANRLSVREPAPAAPADRRYRIEEDGATSPTAKDRAIAENGQRCALIGGRLCTRKPRTVFSAELVR